MTCTIFPVCFFFLFLLASLASANVLPVSENNFVLGGTEQSGEEAAGTQQDRSSSSSANAPAGRILDGFLQSIKVSSTDSSSSTHIEEAKVSVKLNVDSGGILVSENKSGFLAPEKVEQQGVEMSSDRFLIHYSDECVEEGGLPTDLTALAGMLMEGEEGDDDYLDLTPSDGVTGRVRYHDGFFEQIIYSDEDFERINSSNFGKLRRALLKFIAVFLKARVDGRTLKDLTPDERRDLLEDDSIPTLSCKFLHSMRAEYCTMPHLDAALESLNASGEIETRSSAAILDALKRIANENPHFDSNRRQQVLKSLACIQTLNNDEIRQTSTVTPSDPLFAQQWHLQMTDFAIKAPSAWQTLGYPSRANRENGMVVAVIDTGCAHHSDLYQSESNNVFWRNWGETNCNDGIDDDGNGYIDDCFGWDFVNDNKHSENDEAGHGTIVSSVVGALSDNSFGMTGTTWGGRIMCLKAGGDVLYLSDILEAMNYAIEMGARVVNASFGGIGFSSQEYLAIQSMQRHGILLVTAAGNDNCDVDNPDFSCYFTPGAYDLDNILNVGSNTENGGRSWFSCWGHKSVDIFAPGSMIIGASAFDAGQNPCTNCYVYADGTSFSAPVTAGVAAAIWSYFQKENPSGWVTLRATVPEYHLIKDAIMFGSKGSSLIAGANAVNGVVDFERAVTYYSNGIPPPFSPQFSQSAEYLNAADTAFVSGKSFAMLGISAALLLTSSLLW